MANCGAGNCQLRMWRREGLRMHCKQRLPGRLSMSLLWSGNWWGKNVGLNAFVDVSISVLPLLEAARFFDSVHSRRILVPADMLHKLNKRVHLKVKRKRFADVLERLGLTTGGI